MTNKIFFVLGKGGVGKTTISTLLAKHFAAQGKRTLIVECNGARHVSDFFDLPSKGYNIHSLAPRIFTMSMTPLEAIEDYVVQQLKFKKIFHLIFQNRLTQPLIEGSPGLHDAVQLGKIYDLAIQKEKGSFLWDAIIVDAPATGHGLSLLSAAKTMMSLTKTGPMYENNLLVEQVITERSQMVFVTLPEELPCLETLYLWNTIRPDFRVKTKLLFINQCRELPMNFSSPSHPLLQEESTALFPFHSSLLQQWQFEISEQVRWKNWLKAQLPLPISNVPYCKDLHTAQLNPTTVQHWDNGS